MERANKRRDRQTTAYVQTEITEDTEGIVWQLMWRLIDRAGTDIEEMLFASQSCIKDTGDSVGIAALSLHTIQRLLRLFATSYRGLLDNSPAVICKLAPDGTTLFVNNTIAKIAGYKPEDLRGQNWWRALYPGRQYHQVDDLYLQLQSGDIADYEMDLQAQDGSLKTLAWNFYNHHLPNGTFESIICFGVDITERKQAQNELKHTLEKLQRNMVNTINALATTIELRDPYTAGHQRRVAELASAVAREMGIPEERTGVIRLAGIIHDIGKISVPAEILAKPGPINDTEFALIKAHPGVGYGILKTIEFPWPIAQILLQHHEMIDGSGYPLGLKGEDILLEARVLCVADVVEAMASHRPYRPALGINKAIEEITKNKGILYDPDVVDACCALFNKDAFRLE